MYMISKEEGNAADALDYLERHNFYKESVVNRETSDLIKSMQSITKVEMLSKEAQWQKEKKEELQRKNAELDAFVYKVSHDLRGPVSSLMGLFNIVELEIKDDVAMKYFNLYDEHIHRLNNILMDFIDLTQLKEKKLEQSNINFETMVQQCIESFKYLPNYDKIKFDIQIEADLIFANDKSTINTIIQNLIENAIKYSKPNQDGFVGVNIEMNDTKTLLSIHVKDMGIGIKQDNQEKIFDMFFREHHKMPGTGLGLYLLKCAVEKLSGKLNFSSEVNVGSDFSITLPVFQPN